MPIQTYLGCMGAGMSMSLPLPGWGKSVERFLRLERAIRRSRPPVDLLPHPVLFNDFPGQYESDFVAKMQLKTMCKAVAHTLRVHVACASIKYLKC